MAPRYLAQIDLESRVGPAKIMQLFDEDNDGELDEDELATLDEVLEAAEGEVDARLMRAYTVEGITTLADADTTIKFHASWIALEFAAEKRGEFLGAGGIGPYQSQYDRAIKYFEKLSKGRQRSSGESEAGKGAQIGGTLQPALPSDTSRFVFAPDNDNPSGHGGF